MASYSASSHNYVNVQDFMCYLLIILEIVFTRAAPAFHNLLMVMGFVFDINTVHKTVEKLTFQAFY